MITITIKQCDDLVWFLDSDGFHKGWVKSTRVTSDNQKPLNILYFVIHDGDYDGFMGRERPPDQVFDSKEEMLKYYSSKP